MGSLLAGSGPARHRTATCPMRSGRERAAARSEHGSSCRDKDMGPAVRWVGGVQEGGLCEDTWNYGMGEERVLSMGDPPDCPWCWLQVVQGWGPADPWGQIPDPE